MTVLRQTDIGNNMSVYDITLGTRRTDTNTTKAKWEWEELVQRLKKVERSGHTLEQYKLMSKAQRIEAKDAGFFYRRRG